MKTKIELVCPKCEAHLSVDAKREFLYCEYCGTKILLNDENTYTIRHVDEAEILYAETDRIVRLKELELAERKVEAHKENQKRQAKLAKTFVAIGAPMTIVGFAAIPHFPNMLFLFSAWLGILFLSLSFGLAMCSLLPPKEK